MILIMLLRDPRFGDIPALARLHVDAWQTAYKDLLPTQLLSIMSVERRAEDWGRLLDAPR